MTQFQRLLKEIELLKDKRFPEKWQKYRTQPLQEQADLIIEFAKNFINQDGTICAESVAMLFIEAQDLERRIDELECEVRDLRCQINDQWKTKQ